MSGGWRAEASHRSNAHGIRMKEKGEGWSVDTSALLARPLLNGERCLMAMVEDSVGYTNLELLLNAEMQRQSVVASKVFRLSRTQTGNRVKQIGGDGAYQRSQVFNDLAESVGVRPRYAIRNDPNKQALVEVSQNHIWTGARKLMKRAQLPYV